MRFEDRFGQATGLCCVALKKLQGHPEQILLHAFYLSLYLPVEPKIIQKHLDKMLPEYFYYFTVLYCIVIRQIAQISHKNFVKYY